MSSSLYLAYYMLDLSFIAKRKKEIIFFDGREYFAAGNG